MRTALIAGAFACALFAVPAQAQECDLYDGVLTGYILRGEAAFPVPSAELPELVSNVEAAFGTELGDVSRAFVMLRPSVTVIGFEVDGCLLPPFNLPALPEPPAPALGPIPADNPLVGA